VTFSIKIQENIYNLMRHCGYSFEREDKDELVFCRILSTGQSGYPRFHAFIKINQVLRGTSEQTSAVINLHLDQKKPIYQGTSAHSAEYDSATVQKEVERIKQISGL
jgi:hypothetical protein